MHLEEFIQKRLKGINLIHDFSLGAMLCYHELEDKLNKSKAEISENGNIITFEKKGGKVLFAYEDVDVKTLTEGSKLNTRYPINGAKKFKEIVYSLGLIGDYEGKKKYHSLLKPVQIFENRPDLQIELAMFTRAGRAALIDLHDEWVKYKLNLPTVHRISFPTARYRRTIEPLRIPTYKRAIYIKGQLYGFIVFTIENNVAFELSFCTLYWKPEFKILNGLNQYIFSYCLIQLQKEGIQYVNSGFALNKNLKIFKTTSQKSIDVFRYEYSS